MRLETAKNVAPSTLALRFVGKTLDLVAPKASGLRTLCLVNLELFRVFQDAYAHSNQTLARDNRLVAHGCIDTEKGKLTNRAATRNNDVRGDHDMVMYYGAVADVITAPEHDITADLNKRLDGIVFENETVVATFKSGESCCFGTDVTDQFVTLLPGIVVFFSSHVVHSLKAHRNEHLEFRGIVMLFDFVERHDRQIFVGWRLDIIAVERKCHYLMRRIVS